MFWADRFADQIIASGKYQPLRVDDMKTPSGRVHVGSLRGVVIHDLLYKALRQKGKEVAFTYCINDLDPMDGFPIYLDKEKFYKYMGFPLFKIPSPKKSSPNFAAYFAREFIEVFQKIDCHPKVIWTSDLYKTGKFDAVIKQFLDNTYKVRELFKKQYKGFKAEDYFPYQPICPKCGKIATTKINRWDGTFVYFKCASDAVTYTKGCGFEGKVKPEKLNGKLPWKVEWPTHWKVLGVTIEWSGKDHMTKGGSHEIAAKLAEEILNYQTPQAELYEYFLISGKKMSSSKGLGSSAKEIADILPPEILRFLMIKIHYRKTIDFNPMGNTIPNLFDEYDDYATHYYKEKGSDFGRIWELSQVGKIPKKKPFFPRFRDIANYSQSPSVDLIKKFSEIKKSDLTNLEKEILKERLYYVKIWLKNYAPDNVKFSVADKPVKTSLASDQKKYLIKVAELLKKQAWKPEDLQLALYNLTKELSLNPKIAFQAIYLSLIGKTYGPKAAWFLLEQDKNLIIKRFKELSK